MTSETTGQTITVKTEEAAAAATGPAAVKGEWKVRGNKWSVLDDVCHHGPYVMSNLSCVSYSAPWVIVISTEMM